jgi:hypothetical protein
MSDEQQQREPQVVYIERPGNGLAIAALVCGIVGAVIGLVPILFVGAWALGAVALTLGLLARRRAKRTPEAGRGRMALAGVLLGVVAITLGGVGVAIVDDAFDSLTGDDEPQRAQRQALQPTTTATAPDGEERDTDGDGTPDSQDPEPFASGVGDGDDVDDAPTSGDQDEFEEDAPRQRAISVGEAAVDDDITFKVTSISSVDSIPGSEFSEGPLTPRSGAKLVRVDLTYRNNTQTPVDLLCGGASGFVLLDEDDRNYEPVDDLLDLAGNDEVCSENVQPGFRSQVVLAFQVPRGRRVGGLVMWNSEAEDDYNGQATQVLVLPD